MPGFFCGVIAFPWQAPGNTQQLMSVSAWGSDSVPAITLPISQPIISTPIATPIVHHARRLVLALALLLPTTVITTTAAPAQPIGGAAPERFLAPSLAQPALLIAQAPADLMAQAAAQFNRADYPAAIALWTQVLMMNPPQAIANEALVNRAKAYLVVGQPALALADLAATRYQPTQLAALADLWLLKGSAHLQNKEYNQAITSFGQSERLRPSNPILHANRSVAYQSLGRIAEAKADITAAIRLQPSFSNYFNLAVLERLSGRPRECHDLLTQIISKSQPYAQLFVQRGLCAAMLERHDDAIADMLKALKLEASNVDAMQQIGVSLIAKNQRASAKQYLLKASSLRLANGQIDEYQKLLTLIGSLDQQR